MAKGKITSLNHDQASEVSGSACWDNDRKRKNIIDLTQTKEIQGQWLRKTMDMVSRWFHTNTSKGQTIDFLRIRKKGVGQRLHSERGNCASKLGVESSKQTQRERLKNPSWKTIQITMYAKIGALESRELAARFVLEGEGKAGEGRKIFPEILKQMGTDCEPSASTQFRNVATGSRHREQSKLPKHRTTC